MCPMCTNYLRCFDCINVDYNKNNKDEMEVYVKDIFVKLD